MKNKTELRLAWALILLASIAWTVSMYILVTI
jgi:hypothetical protein